MPRPCSSISLAPSTCVRGYRSRSAGSTPSAIDTPAKVLNVTPCVPDSIRCQLRSSTPARKAASSCVKFLACLRKSMLAARLRRRRLSSLRTLARSSCVNAGQVELRRVKSPRQTCRALPGLHVTYVRTSPLRFQLLTENSVAIRQNRVKGIKRDPSVLSSKKSTPYSGTSQVRGPSNGPQEGLEHEKQSYCKRTPVPGSKAHPLQSSD